MIKDIIINAGKILKEDYSKSIQSEEKSKFDLVTEFDKKIESIIITEIDKLYKNDSIFSEEAGQITKGNDRRWIIDPIDGTTDFIFGVPYFAISVCLEAENQITEAFIYNPISEEFFYSNNKDNISYLNDKVIYTSKTTDIEKCLIAFGFSANLKNIEKYASEWKFVFNNCKKGLPLISPALTICNIARGRIDAFIDFGSSMEGQAGASLILKNAGGKLFNYDFSSYDHTKKGIIATNGTLNINDLRNLT